MKRVLAYLAIILLCGCTTPAGKLTKDDFVWKKIDMPGISYAESYRRMLNGFRTAGAPIAEANLYPDNKTGFMDLYLKGLGGGRSDWVVGRVEIVSMGEGSIVSVGYNNCYPGGPSYLELWETYLGEQYK